MTDLRGMRQLNRGKRIDNGEWVEGYLLVDDISGISAIVTYVNLSGDISDLSEINIFRVIPETVGQYTGLKDKNGKRIFDGDILESRYDDEYPDNLTIEVVMWIYNGWHTKQGDITPDMIDDVDTMPYSEVVGNVHDNGELLNGE